VNRAEALELAAIVNKTVGPDAWEGVLRAAEDAYTNLRDLWPNVVGFNLPWSAIDAGHRLVFIGLTASLYSTGFERGVEVTRGS